ncbi:MAG: hypothetical protein ABJH68_15765 [Ilumatobacter sp.]|uniref:sterol desaturase family protein n=1 Tax=Ilumatobacter sp. TaxID=1967498 RepID=UPI003297E68D
MGLRTVIHRLLVTPEFHHWHHSNVPAAHHTNYSILFPVWDMVFGTYRMPRGERPTVYGVDDAVPPTMVGQLWWPFRDVGRPSTWSVRRGRRAVATLVRDIVRSTRRPVRRSDGTGT